MYELTLLNLMTWLATTLTIAICLMVIGPIMQSLLSAHPGKVFHSYFMLLKLRLIKEPVEIYYQLRKMNPYLFEEVLLTALSQAGYKIKRNKKYSGDGGIDGRVWINGQLYYVQAKRYRGHISRSHVEHLNWICHRDKVRGLFIHTGKTGKGSWQQAKSSPLAIISGEQLLTLLLAPKSWRPTKV